MPGRGRTASRRRRSRPTTSLRAGRLRRRRRRILFAAVVVALAVAIALGIVALFQRNTAIEQSRISRSRELAASAVSQLAADPELSLLLARKAVDVRETPQAENALRRSLRESHLRLTLGEGTGPATSARFSPDGTRIVCCEQGRWRESGTRGAAGCSTC